MDAVTTVERRSGYSELLRLISLQTGDEKHSTAAASTLDVIWVLYDRVLRLDPSNATDPERDRFLLSKGHGPMAFYAVLAARGLIEAESLAGFGEFGSRLGHHPDRNLVPGVEISSGSLGHGLPIAVGLAHGLRVQGRTGPRVFCLVGDAELDEGSNAEAIAVAARLGLDRLTAIVIDNRSSTLGWPGGIAGRFTVEGWSALTIDGRDHDAIFAGLSAEHAGTPHVVVAVVEERS